MIETSLDPGEQLIWLGNPDPVRYAAKYGAGLFLMGISNVGVFLFFIYAMAQISLDDTPFGLPLWAFATPILLVGVCFMLAPGWHFLRGMRTTYALTDRRAITDVSGLFSRRLSLPLNEISVVDVQSSTEGPGHVFFQEPDRGSYSYPGIKQRDGFVAVADAAKAGYLLRSAMEKFASARQGSGAR